MLGRGRFFDLLFLLLARLARSGASRPLLGLELIAKFSHLEDELVKPHLLTFIAGIGRRFGKGDGKFAGDSRKAILQLAAGRASRPARCGLELFEEQLGELRTVEPRITFIVGFDTVAINVGGRRLNDFAEHRTPEFVVRNVLGDEFGDRGGSLQVRIHEPGLFLASLLLARRRLRKDSRAAIEVIGVSNELIRHIILAADWMGFVDRLDIVISQDGYSQR